MNRNKAKFYLFLLLFCINISFAVNPMELIDEESRFLKLNGINVHYKVQGNANDIMLLFHGFGSSTFTWSFIEDAFLSEFSLISYDRPAFGLTERVVDVEKFGYNVYHFDNQSQFAKELIKSIGINVEKIFLVGHSAGSPIAIDYYNRYPENIKGLILISPALYHKLSENPFAKTFSNPLLRGTVSLFKNLLARTLEGGLDESWYDPSKITEEIRTEYKKFTRIDDWEKALIEFTLNQGDFDMLPVLETLEVPVLIIFGTDDKIILKDEVLFKVKDKKNVKVVLLEKTGHVPHEESPDQVVQAIKKWLSNLP